MSKLNYYFENISLPQFTEELNNLANADRNIVLELYKAGSNINVSIYKKLSMRNSFNPEFTGRLEEFGDGVKMSGTLGVPIIIKLFFLFSSLFAWALFAIMLLATLFFPENTSSHSIFIGANSENADIIFIIVCGIFFVFFHVLFILLGTVGQRGNKKYIIKFIERLQESLKP